MKNTSRKPMSLLVSFVLAASSLGQPALVAAGQIVAARAVPANLSGSMGGYHAPTPFRSSTDFKLPASLVGLRYSPALTAGPSVNTAAQFGAAEVELLSAEQFRASAATGFTKSSARADRKGVFAVLRDRIAAALDVDSSLGSIFDAGRVPGPAAVMGITGKPIKLPAELKGIVLGPAPQAPNPKDVAGISLLGFDIPGTRGLGGIFEQGATVLSADPTKVDDVERALRALVDADAARFGVPSKELKTIHVKRMAGAGNQADTVYALFRQQKDGIEMDGSYLQFTIKIIKGEARIMAAKAQLYPNVSVATQPAFTDEELKAKAVDGIQLPQSMADRLEKIGRRVIYSNGRWVTANLYTIEGLPFIVAVDVVTGEAFAWESRVDLLENAPASTGGKIDGRTVDKGPTRPNSELTAIPLPNIAVKLDNGQTVVTDKDGKFTVPSLSDSKGKAPTSFTASLAGVYAVINDEQRKGLKVSGALKPGEEITITFNPTGDANDENAIAQISAYRLVNRVHDWAKDRGIDEKRLDVALPVNVNIDDECNAYYTPGRPSLNFFKSSRDCSNSSYDTVVMHEWGHFADDMIGGIVNGGLSEGFGDIFSMFILGNPIIGEGFLKNRNPDYIRHGDNAYQYNEYDEVHDQGQAWMGFAWKLRKALLASLGEAGAAVAETIVLPTLYAKATTIPEAIAQVLLNDMDKEGNLPHEKQIRDAASAHGITLPKSPGSLLAQFMGFVGSLTSRRQPPSVSYLGVKLSDPLAKKIAWGEDGDGFHLVSVTLKDGRTFDATVVDSRYIVPPKGEKAFTIDQIDDIQPSQLRSHAIIAAAAGVTFKPAAYSIDGRSLSDDQVVKAKLAFSASYAIRDELRRYIERYCDFHELKYSLNEYRSWFSSDFVLIVTGPKDKIDNLFKKIDSAWKFPPFKGGAAVALSGAWSEKLQAWPERGMGYQKVDVTLKDGTVLRSLVAVNSSSLALPAGVAAFAEADVLALREAASGNAAEELVNATVTFSAGALIRNRIAAEVRRFCDYHVAKGNFKTYALHESRGLFSSDFTLDINGKDSVIDLLISQLQKHQEFRGRSLSLSGGPVSDGALRAAYSEVLAARSDVWSGKLAPADFYAKAKSLYEERFGPEWEHKVRLFLSELARAKKADAGRVDFSAMTSADRDAFFAAMPKGSELHIHLTGAIAPDVWLKVAEMLGMEFPTKAVAELIRHIGEDPAGYGLDESREKVSIDAMSPALKAALGRTLVTGPNDKSILDFLKKWTIIGPMDRPESQYTLFTALATASKAQNIQYLEIITSSFGLVLEKAAEAARLVEKETGVVIRLIAYGGWYMTPEQVDAGMKAAHELSGDGVVGFNMVADEAKFRPLLHYESFRKLRETMPELSVTLHAGEQPGTADNMVNDLLLGVKRYGHGTQVDEDALAMAILYAAKTPVEVSLISNELTRVMTDLTKHPLPRMLAWGVPVILSTDDPGIYASTLGQEYERAQSLYGLSWEQLKEIARNGIRHAFLDAAKKAELLAGLETRFAAFESSEVFRRAAR